MQYVIIGLGSFALTTSVMWWALSRRLRRRAMADGVHAAQGEVWDTKPGTSADILGATIDRGVLLAFLVVATVIAGFSGVFGLSTMPAQIPTHPGPLPTSPVPSAPDGLVNGGGLGGGDGQTDREDGRTADGEGLIPLLSADNLGALGSFIGGFAAAATVCFSVYQFRVNQSASALATPRSAEPPSEPPPSEGYL